MTTIFFVDNLKYTSENYWLLWLYDNVNKNFAVATDGEKSPFLLDKFTTVSTREGINASNGCVAVSFASSDIDYLNATRSVKKILYVNNLPYLYASTKHLKHPFFIKLERYSGDKNINVCFNSKIDGINQKSIVYPYDKESVKKYFFEA